MKVYLNIKGHDELPPFSPGGSSLPSFTTNASAVVSASIVLEDGDVPGLYMLQVGNNPDIRIHVNINKIGQEAKFVWEHYDDKLRCNIKEEKFKLFRDTMGTSYLYLIEYDNEQRFIQMAEVTVLLDKLDVRGGYYDRMVKDLFCQGLPHFVLNDFKWQMARNKFSIGWNDGYTSVENPDVMLLALLRIVRKMRPLLAQINESAQMSFCRVPRRRHISQISHYDKRTLRGIASAMRHHAADWVIKVSEESVQEPCRQATFNTPAHSVLFTFLSTFILDRINVIEDNLSLRIEQLAHELPTDGSFSSKNIVTDKRAVFQSLDRKLKVSKRLKNVVLGLMSYQMFSSGHEVLSVYDVDASEFSSNDAYLKLYFLLLDYSRVRFWWIGDKKNGIWRIPKIQLSDSGESRLQLKYSIVYENWCYARMIRALVDDLHYDCIMGRTFEDCDEALVVFRKDNIQVKLMHGITAKKPRKDRSSEFVYTGEDSNKKTPDFAIVICNRENNKDKWVVLDAKSDARLRSHMVKARSKYAIIERHGEKPFASILFRSGESDGECAGIEFPSPPIFENRATVIQKDEEKLDDHSKDDYKWVAGRGIVEGEKNLPPYHGNLRVNVASLTNNETVFSEFMDGLITTALRLLRNENE